MILDEDAERCILVTQPRRVAATSLARRVAGERGGDFLKHGPFLVGYRSLGGCQSCTGLGGCQVWRVL